MKLHNVWDRYYQRLSKTGHVVLHVTQSALLIAVIVLLSSCTRDTTPTPTDEPTVAPTVAQEVLFYFDCFTGERVEGFAQVNTNNNPCLVLNNGNFQTVDLGTADGRYVALYDGYWYWQFPALQRTFAYQNAGATFFRGGTFNGMTLELVQVDGQFGVQFEQVFEPDICYLIKQTGSHSIPNGSTSDISLSAQIHLTDERIIQLRNQSFGGRFSGTNGHEIFWIVQTDELIDGVIAVYSELVWGSFLQGTQVSIHALEVLHAPDDFCNGDSAVTF